MAYGGNLFLLILSFLGCHAAPSKDCELGKSNEKHDAMIPRNARRYVDPHFKFKFGITYPTHGHTYAGYTTRDPNRKYRVVTPPSNFFPKGSSPHTITILPWMILNTPVLSWSNNWNICHFLVKPCMRVQKTGPVCASSMHLTYMTFDNYCALEFANCTEKLAVWKLVYFGSCTLAKLPDAYEELAVEGDNFWEDAFVNVPPYNPLTGKQVTVFRRLKKR